MDNRSPQHNTLVATNWDTNKQNEWITSKARAITEAAEHLTNGNPDFESFYNFLIAKRANIANELTPMLVSDINTRREQPFHTTISSENGYADYLYSVTELFDDLFDKAKLSDKNDEDKENPGMANMMAIHYFSISPVSKKDNKKIALKGYTCADVNNNDTTYSKIYKFTIQKEGDAHPSTLIVISHPDGARAQKALTEASKIFHELQTNSNLSDPEKIEKIKQIAWHAFHAMPQKRGSAAIGEMLIESLLKYHKINFKLERKIELPPGKDAPSIDLIAILSATPEIFSQRVKLNSDLEKSLKSTIDIAKTLDPTRPDSVIKSTQVTPDPQDKSVEKPDIHAANDQKPNLADSQKTESETKTNRVSK